MTDLATELLFASMGLHGNATNKDFRPKPETIQGWANLMSRAYRELGRLEGEVRTANAMVDDVLRLAQLQVTQPAESGK